MQEIVINIWTEGCPEPELLEGFGSVGEAQEKLRELGFVWEPIEPGDYFYIRGNQLARICLPKA